MQDIINTTRARLGRNYKRRNIGNVGARNATRANVKALCHVLRILTSNH